MKRLLTFTARLAEPIRKSVNNVLASRRLAFEAREKRLALSATPVPFASPPTDSETILCCTAQLDADYMEAIPIAAEVLAAPPQRYGADGGAQTNENVDACNAVLADWKEDEDFLIEEEPGLSAAVDSETTFGYGEPDDFLACAALEEDDGEVPDDALGDGCGSECDNGCSNAVGTIHLGGSGNFIEACYDGSAPTSTLELVVLQDELGMVSIPAWMTGTNEFGYNFAITISNPGSYWNKSIGSSNDTFVWTKPNNVSNESARRDFTVNYIVYHDSNNNGVYDENESIAASESAYLHIAYAEAQVKIAGEGDFEPLTSSNNKAIVGQKIEARIALDPRLSIPTNGQRSWSFSTTLSHTSRIKDYLTNGNYGYVEELEETDYSLETIKFYEIEAQTTTIMCQVPVQWPQSGEATLRTSSIYCTTDVVVVAPSASISAEFVADVDVLNNTSPKLLVGPTITINASVSSVEQFENVPDTGQVNFLQTLQDNSEKKNESTELGERKAIYGEDVLDTHFPLGTPSISGTNQPPLWRLTSQGKDISTLDQPREDLTIKENNGYYQVHVNLAFTKTVIYKPNGVDSIWIPLSKIYWSWEAYATYSQTTSEWSIISSDKSITYGGYLISLQKWYDNVANYMNW